MEKYTFPVVVKMRCGGRINKKVVVVNMDLWFEESKKHNLQVV